MPCASQNTVAITLSAEGCVLNFFGLRDPGPTLWRLWALFSDRQIKVEEIANVFKTNDDVSYHWNIYRANIFAKKMWGAFAFAKATHIFQQNTCELDVLNRTINILTINELIKLTMLRTTGPWSGTLLYFIMFYSTHSDSTSGQGSSWSDWVQADLGLHWHICPKTLAWWGPFENSLAKFIASLKILNY